MKSILKVRTQSFLETKKQKIFQDIVEEEIVESVKNISSKSEDQVKQWIKEGTLTDKLLVYAIKNVMKERINNG
jgi:carbonic anhydrase